MAAGAGFALLTRAVEQRTTAAVDRRVHPKAKVSKRRRARKAAEVVGRVGKWWLYVPAAYAAAATFVAGKTDDRTAISGAVAIAATATAAAVINEFIDDLVPQPPAPPGRPSPDHPVYPSGHAFGTSALAFSLAWVLVREGGRRPALVIPLTAILPFVSAGARMMEEKHWLSDVAGGFLAGVSLAAIPLAIHEASASLMMKQDDEAEIKSERGDQTPRRDSRRPRSAAQVGRKTTRRRVGSE